MNKEQLTKKYIKLQKQLNNELVELAALKQKSTQLSVVYDDIRVRDEKSNALAKELLERQKELHCMLDRSVGQLSARKENMLQTSEHFVEMMNELPASFKNKLKTGFERIQKLDTEFNDEDFKFFEGNIPGNETENFQEIVEENHEETVCKQDEEVLEVLDAEETVISEPYVDKLNDLIELIFDDECRLSLDIVPNKSLMDQLDNSFKLDNNFSLETVKDCISIHRNLELQLDDDRVVDPSQLELIFNPDSILRLVVEESSDLNKTLDNTFVLELIPFKSQLRNTDSTLLLDLQIDDKKQAGINPKLITNSIGSIPTPSKSCLKCGQACRLHMNVCPYCYAPLDAKSAHKEKIKSSR